MKKWIIGLLLLASPALATGGPYCILTGQIASLVAPGLAYGNQKVTFRTNALKLPACGSTTPIAPSSQDYKTDGSGNLPANLYLQQGAHVDMIIGYAQPQPLIIPCQSTISINELIPAQNPMPDAVSEIILDGPLFSGVSVVNPPVGTIGPSTLQSPASQQIAGSSALTVNFANGPVWGVLLHASFNITLGVTSSGNFTADGGNFIVDTIEDSTGGYVPTFVPAAGFTLVWAGGGPQPSVPTTAGSYAAWFFTVQGTVIVGSAQQESASGLTTAEGIADIGRVTIAQAATPTNPSVTAVGTTGATTYSYYVVCDDYNGGKTLPSAATTITNGSSVLSGTNYNQVCPVAEAGCGAFDILKGNTGTLLTTLNAPSGCVNDQGQPTTVYSTPTRNTTGDLSVAGNITGNQLTLSTGPLTVGSGFSVSGGNITASGSLTLTGNIGAQAETLAGGLTAGGSIVSSGLVTGTTGIIAGSGSTGSFVNGDISASEGAGTGRLWLGTNGAQSLDFGIANSGKFTLTGGGLAVPSLMLNGTTISNAPALTWTGYLRTGASTEAFGYMQPPSPITYLSICVYMQTAPSGCSIQPTVGLDDVTASVLSSVVTISNSVPLVCSNITAFNVAANHEVAWSYVAGTGCSPNPADLSATAIYRMQ